MVLLHLVLPEVMGWMLALSLVVLIRSFMPGFFVVLLRYNPSQELEIPMKTDEEILLLVPLNFSKYQKKKYYLQ